ncbi:hypothetical protein HLI_07045 [Halobacillus litoralis]|uniref:Uncharacterized protein n=1 Tax=Halobacillus litoralis TaxID=45668 RepID=A0A410MBH1_9BACI|nr:hypothetical protein HLI_07045 [Halobacillus litoralis]
MLKLLKKPFQSRGTVKVCCCFSRIACRWMLAAGTASTNLVKKNIDQVDLRLALFPQASPPNAHRGSNEAYLKRVIFFDL